MWRLDTLRATPHSRLLNPDSPSSRHHASRHHDSSLSTQTDLHNAHDVDASRQRVWAARDFADAHVLDLAVDEIVDQKPLAPKCRHELGHEVEARGPW
eukprot:685666-Rhodomonas_salina.8